MHCKILDPISTVRPKILGQLLPRLLFCSVCAALHCSAQTPAPRIEVISHTREHMFDDRPAAIVVVDPGVLSFAKTREFILQWFADKSYREITICDSEKFNYTDDNAAELIFCFGNNPRVLIEVARKPALIRPVEIYMIFPRYLPPTSDAVTFIGVVVAEEPEKGTVDQAWRIWCRNNGMPCTGAKVGNAQSLKRALDKVSNKVDELRSKAHR